MQLLVDLEKFRLKQSLTHFIFITILRPIYITILRPIYITILRPIYTYPSYHLQTGWVLKQAGCKI